MTFQTQRCLSQTNKVVKDAKVIHKGLFRYKAIPYFFIYVICYCVNADTQNSLMN